MKKMIFLALMSFSAAAMATDKTEKIDFNQLIKQEKQSEESILSSIQEENNTKNLARKIVIKNNELLRLEDSEPQEELEVTDASFLKFKKEIIQVKQNEDAKLRVSDELQATFEL